MNEESKLIELFKKYPGIAARIRRSFAYHYDQIQREIESEVATINKDDAATIIDYTTEYMEESMNWPDPDNQDKAYQEIIDQVNAEYGDGGVLQFYSLQGIKEYFEIVHIQTQELTSIGFKTAILDL